MAAPAPAGAFGVATEPLAATQAAAVEAASFWLGNGGANLAAATPYSVQTAVDKITTGGGIAPGTKPGSVPPSLPAAATVKAVTGKAVTGKAVTPATAGKVFFIGADGQPHWCTGTAMQSQYRNVVATAAHCVYDTQSNGYPLGKWVFVPGYAGAGAPSGLYVGKQLFGHYDFDVYRDYDRDYAFVTVWEGVVTSPTGEPANFGRLGDNVGGQGLAWNQPPVDATVDVFGYPAGPHPDGRRPYTGETLETSSGRTTTAMAPSLKGEELLAVGSPFTGEGALGSSWLLSYDKAGGSGYLNGLTISVADTDADQRYDTSLSPYFDGETQAVYAAAAAAWSGAVLPG
ncbi:trypsin-like serine peptidase [Nonomuraea sp. GTA35]|uniref:trypsin-like serine peptidase n=1 Tax=Nonomuraea sp. GTA35 TaxID=1676746 RepID=UPI0035C1BD17